MSSLGTTPTIESVTSELLRLVDEEVLTDLQVEDPAAAIELHFPPVRVQALPAATVDERGCSTDGCYDTEIDPKRPWIIYADDVRPARLRFTLLHELAHHLFVTNGAHLLDDLDVIVGSSETATKLEETICHRFAGRVLVPEHLLSELCGSEQLRPGHIEAVKQRSTASWEAVAVRAAEWFEAKFVVVLIRQPGVISFAAGSSRMGWTWWPRNSPVDPNGPLARALDGRQTARPETYRYGLAYQERMFCDTLPVHSQLAVAVLADRPSDNHFEILQAPDPIWSDREEFCALCGDERDQGWCDLCRGRLCHSCQGCGCNQPVANPLCPACGLKSPARPGGRVCRTCEADGLG